MNSELPKYIPEVLSVISKLNYMDPIAVIWVDASQSTRVPPPKNGVLFANHSIETEVSSAGQYICLQKGESYNDQHLVILMSMSDKKNWTIQSIPLQNVKSISFGGQRKRTLISLKRFFFERIFSRKTSTSSEEEIGYADLSRKRIGGW